MPSTPCSVQIELLRALCAAQGVPPENYSLIPQPNQLRLTREAAIFSQADVLFSSSLQHGGIK